MLKAPRPGTVKTRLAASIGAAAAAKVYRCHAPASAVILSAFAPLRHGSSRTDALPLGRIIPSARENGGSESLPRYQAD